MTDIAEAVLNTRGGAWGPDGTIIFGTASTGLWLVPARGGSVRKLTTVRTVNNSHRWPSFLPDGRHFLYFSRGNAQQRGVYLGSLDGGDTTHLLDSLFNAVYADGYVLTVKDGTLVAYPFDEATRRISGEPFVVPGQLGGSTTQQSSISVSTNGVLVYSGPLLDNTELLWYDRAGRVLGQAEQATLVNFRLSPDESEVATTRIDPVTNTMDIWLRHLARSTSRRLTLDPLNDVGPLWSRDGRRFVFRSDREGDNYLFEHSSTRPNPSSSWSG